MASISRCVLVDDDPDFLRLLRLCLYRLCAGWEIRTFHSTLEALGYLTRHPADLVITGDEMPVIDGSRLIARLRALRADMLIILLAERDRDGPNGGADALVLKRDLAAELGPALQRIGALAIPG